MPPFVDEAVSSTALILPGIESEQEITPFVGFAEEEALQVEEGLLLPEISAPPEAVEEEVKPEEAEQGRAEAGAEDIRAIALEDYVEEAVAAPPPVGARLVAWLQSLSLVQRLILAGLILINTGLFAVGTAILFASVYSLINSGLPATVPTVKQVIQVPYPMKVTLPGGWAFDIHPGTVVDGKWAPQRGEWLQGTEIHRWVALPWNEQLEAVFQTFQPGDEINVVMSNADRLKYKVQSVQEVPANEAYRLSPDYPSLIIILANDISDTRWVAIATP
jgi:hypothetical protein